MTELFFGLLLHLDSVHVQPEHPTRVKLLQSTELKWEVCLLTGWGNLSQVDVVDNPTIIAGLHISPEGGRHHPEEDKISPSHNNLQRSPGHQSGEIEGGLRSPLIVSSSTRPVSTLVLQGTMGRTLGLQLTETGRKAIFPKTVKEIVFVFFCKGVLRSLIRKNTKDYSFILWQEVAFKENTGSDRL